MPYVMSDSCARQLIIKVELLWASVPAYEQLQAIKWDWTINKITRLKESDETY